MKNSSSILLITLLFASCEKVVNLEYKDNQSRIVIEGNITDQPGPYSVKVTRSVGLTATGTYPTIDNAVVTLSDDAGNSETLAPRGNGLYKTALASGAPGRTYTLTVTADGQTYTASSTMPQRVPLDSVKVEEVTFGGETERNLIPVYLDPVAKGNNYLFLVTINNKLHNQHLIQNDEIKNGAVNTIRLEINDNDLKLTPGDSVKVTMQCIDSKVALFYTTLALISDNGPGGGTTPSNPPGNISDGALGIFSAHTTDTRTIVIR